MRPSFYVCVLALLAALLAPPRAHALPNNPPIVFQGPNAIMVKKDIVVYSGEGDARLICRIAGQPDRQLLTIRPGVTWTGEALATGLPYNKDVAIVCQHTDDKGNDTTLEAVANTTLGPSAAGLLKFNYSIDGGTIGGSLYIMGGGLDVAAGATLTLSNVKVMPLTGSVHLKWTASGGVKGALGQPLTHAVLVSGDGGATWRALYSFLDTPDVWLRTEALGAGTYKLRLISSDGNRAATRDVANLTVANRAPTIVIESPVAPNLIGSAATPWSLVANAWDVEDGAVRTPMWRSSLQGWLGGKKSLAVMLKPGLHTLTFSCADSKGLAATASVQVLVKPSAVAGQAWLGLE